MTYTKYDINKCDLSLKHPIVHVLYTQKYTSKQLTHLLLFPPCILSILFIYLCNFSLNVCVFI